MDGLNTSPQMNQIRTLRTKDNYYTRMSVRSEIDLYLLLNLDILQIPSTRKSREVKSTYTLNQPGSTQRSIRVGHEESSLSASGMDGFEEPKYNQWTGIQYHRWRK